jgi:hypothetical protein
MIKRSEFSALKDRATGLLISRGYELVPPTDSWFVTRYIPLHLIGLRSTYEALCVKLKIAYSSVSDAYIESFCRYEICQFRSFLTIYPGNVFLRCEVWVVSPNGSIHCYEVLPNEIREVAAYAR